MITGYDHVQVAIPAGSEEIARAYYRDVLHMTELPKPPALAVRGGCWFTAGDAALHLGVEHPFVPAGKAHPAFLVTDVDVFDELAELAATVRTLGYAVTWSNGQIPGVRRFHTVDPFGNRLEFQGV